MKAGVAFALTLVLLHALADPSFGVSVYGRVVDETGAPVSGARLTLLGASNFFKEARSSTNGDYRFADVPFGKFRLGASFPEREYQEVSIELNSGDRLFTWSLGPERHQGRWTTLRRLEADTFGGTNSGVLLPDARIMYCHDTLDPLIFDPTRNSMVRPPPSPRLQGCHAVCLLQDGRLIYAGGTDRPEYGPGTRQVKAFDPRNLIWKILPNLVKERWYPTMTQLPDGQLLVIGGGGLQNPKRVKTSEVFDPTTFQWRRVGDVAIPNEVSPIVLLLTGQVFMTHRPPQLFNPETETWRKAADFIQGNRMPNGDHSDHEIVLLPDGRVVAVGYKSFTPGNIGNMVEIYNSATNSWKLGASMAPVRSRASIVLLPDKKILVMGGFNEDSGDPTEVNAWGYTKLTDLYDPLRNRWRRLREMRYAREFHAVPLLIPDGRIIVVGGEGQPGVEPDFNVIEAFEPPYLFRGPRPEIRNLSVTKVRRGSSLTFSITRTNRPTSLILMGTGASTHFMDSGNARHISLPFVQSGNQIIARVPADSARVPLGFYMLFAMVDDIPSRGVIVQILP